MTVLKATELINSSIAVSPKKGIIIYDYLRARLEKKEKVELSFNGIEQITTAFLNEAIGKLYRNFSPDELNACLKITNIDQLDKYLLLKVIKRARIDFDKESDLFGEGGSENE